MTTKASKAKRRKVVAQRIAEDDADRVFVTPAEFERWLKKQGLKISHKNLYETYLGPHAVNQIPRSSDGKRVHKDKGLELIKLVQSKQDVDPTNVAQRRAEAAARLAEAKAAKQELEASEAAGSLLDVDLVKQVWTNAIEATKNEMRSMVNTLPAELVGRNEDEIRTLLDKSLRAAQEHLAVQYTPAKKQAKGK